MIRLNTLEVSKTICFTVLVTKQENIIFSMVSLKKALENKASLSGLRKMQNLFIMDCSTKKENLIKEVNIEI